MVLPKLKKHKFPEAIADTLEISWDKVLDIARQKDRTDLQYDD